MIGGKHYLHFIRVKNLIIFLERLGQRGNLHGRIFKARNQRFDLLRDNKRLVSLHVNHHVKIALQHLFDFRVRLVTPIRSTPMRIGSHYRTPTKSKHGIIYTLVIRRHVYVIRNNRSLLIHVLNHRFSGNIHQRFPRKTGGSITGRNQYQ